MYFIEWSKHNFILLLVGILFTLSSEANGLSHCETVEETVIAPWGEVIHYFVFLPKGYSRERHYSTQYFLHGLGGNRYWLNDFGMCGLLDQLVDEGRNPYVIVAPEGGNTTYWANGAQNGKNMGDFLSKTLIADAQSKYSLIDLVEARQIAGISMGGTSAIREQLRQPGIWGSTVAHSPIVRTFEEATKDFPDVFGTLRDFQGLDPFSLIKIHHKKLYGKLFMDAGGGDFGFWNANNLANLLKEEGVQGEFRMGEDVNAKHDPGYWNFHYHTRQAKDAPSTDYIPNSYNYMLWDCEHIIKPIKL